MEFIGETIIDEVAEQIGAEEAQQTIYIQELEEEQPFILAFLFSENAQLLAQQEQEYLLYLVLVLWKSINKVHPGLPLVEETQLGEREEANWTMIQAATAKRFRDRLDLFFENYPQEDLLAFIEDALTDDEEDAWITKIGREALFIMAKTVLDCLIGYKPG